MPPGCVLNITDMVTLFLSMRYSSGLMISNIIYGEQSIKKACPVSEANVLGMVKLLMCSYRNGVIQRPLNSFSCDC